MKNLFTFLLFLFSVSLFAATRVEVVVEASKMARAVNNVVIVPDDYTTNKQYPVLYLLHGYGGNHNDWSNIVPQILSLSDRYQMIVICPNALNSWYFDSPINPQSQFETYMTKDLIEFVDGNYSTIPNRNGRAITGLSMGGHGALYLASRHQDIYSAVGSMSGGVDLTQSSQQFELSKVLGEYESNKELWESSSAVNAIKNISNGKLKMLIDCGRNDIFFAANELLHANLVEKGVDHDYISRPGAHDWSYWKNAIHYQMLFMKMHFDNKAATEIPGGNIFFYDSPSRPAYDPSWATVTAPSVLPEMNGKFMVDKDVKYSGENSLRLKWNSKTGGNWSACIASEAWKIHDFSKVKEVRLMISCLENISNENLPLVYFQNGGYQLSTKQKLGKYVSGDLEANMWIEIVIPVADLTEETVNYDLSSTKSLFFGQDKADGIENTIYIDYITLIDDPDYKPSAQILFEDSGSDSFYDQSWLNVTSPSSCVSAAGKPEKLPVVTDIKYSGDNALKLQYSSKEGGNWMALVASVGWKKFDLSHPDFALIFMINSPVIVESGDDLPQVCFEAHSGGTSGKLALGNYITSLKANEWTKVSIPISDFVAKDPSFNKWDNIKGLFFSQLKTNSKEFTLYIDNFVFDQLGDLPSSEERIPELKNEIYYANKLLNLPERTGFYSITDLSGQIVKKVDSSQLSKVPVELIKGIYIVSNGKITNKILVD